VMEAIHSSGTSILTRATRLHIPEGGVLQGKEPLCAINGDDLVCMSK
jgi:hypothetical protein